MLIGFAVCWLLLTEISYSLSVLNGIAKLNHKSLSSKREPVTVSISGRPRKGHHFSQVAGDAVVPKTMHSIYQWERPRRIPSNSPRQLSLR
ncbi:hypothetical protein HDV62DRAFT_346453 [Trichoderma sp. SZMC 28011]